MSLTFPPVLSSSIRETWNKCHAKFYWEQIYGVVPVGQNVHLIFGGAYAKALEFFRTGYYGDKYEHLTEAERYNESVCDGLEALIRAYGTYEAPEGETKTFDRLVGAYVEYLYRYPPSSEHAPPSIFEGKPRVEFSFVFEISEVNHPETGDPLLFCGRFDQLAEYTGAMFVFDDKTTQRMGPTWADQWGLRSQFTAYSYGAQVSGHRVAGAIVRGMCILKTKFNTAEALLYRPQWMIDRWRERLTWDAQRMVDHFNKGYWPTNGEESGACADYGGCPFRLICSSESTAGVLPVHYKKYKWDPLEREGGSISKAIDDHKMLEFWDVAKKRSTA